MRTECGGDATRRRSVLPPNPAFVIRPVHRESIGDRELWKYEPGRLCRALS